MTYADESHHATADSYQKLMEYFTPGFSLGMTATPDKMDDNIEGHNVYELFDHIKMPDTNKTAVEINWIFDNPVKEELYQYIING